MPAHQTLETWISTNDVRLKEYDVQDETSAGGIKQVTCWIPSESGQDFMIHFKDSRRVGRPYTAWYVSADGKQIGGKILYSSHDPNLYPNNEITFSDVPTTDGRKCLAFSSLQLTDDDSLLNHTEHLAIGELKIQAYMVALVGAPTRTEQSSVVMNTGTVHERSKKGMIHNVQLGSVSTCPTPNTQNVEHIGPPLVEFLFRYRPLDILQANGIAPPPTPKAALPSPRITPTRSESPEVQIKPEPGSETQTDEEIQRLESQLASLKRKRGTESGGTVKQEPGLVNKRLRAHVSDEVIDLTLDDE